MKLLAAIIAVLPLISNASSPHKGYLVKLKPNVAKAGMRTLAQYGIQVESQIPQLNIVRVKENPFEMNLASGEKQILNELVEYVEPNYIRQTVVAPVYAPREERAEITDSWSMKLINAPDAWTISTGTKNTLVSVSDTGIWEHADLVDNYWHNPGENGLDANGKDKRKNKIDDDKNGYVDDHSGWDWTYNGPNSSDSMYHGTHVAGILGAAGNGEGIVGVSWHVNMISAKFIDRDGSGTDENAIKSLVYSSDMGAKAINCSWGGSDPTKALYDAVEYMKTKGVLMIAAAGNDGNNSDKYPHYPSAMDNENIISVASVDNLKGDLSFFSTWGPKTVDIGAPGRDIYSTFNPTYSPLHRVWYEKLSGTSMAAPHVTGAVALMYSVNPNLNWRQVKDILLSTVTKAPKLKGKIVSEGIMNVGAAVRAAQSLK